MADNKTQWTPQGPLDRFGNSPTIDPTLPDYTGIYGAPVSISPGLTTATPTGASVPAQSPGFALPNVVNGLGGNSQARITAPPEPESKRDWAAALQAFGAGLADAGMGMQGRQGNALATFMELQQKDRERQAVLAEKRREMLDKQRQQDFQETLSVLDKLGGDPKKTKAFLDARRTGGSLAAETFLRAGYGEEDYGEAQHYIPTIRKFDPQLAEQLERDPRSVPTPFLKATMETVRDLRKKEFEAQSKRNLHDYVTTKAQRGEALSGGEQAIYDELLTAQVKRQKAEVEADTAKKYSDAAARLEVETKTEEFLTKRTYGLPQAAANLAQTQGQNILDPAVLAAKKELAHAGRSSQTVVLPPQEGAFAKELGKAKAEIITKAYETAKNAESMLKTIEEGRTLLSGPITLGFGSDVITGFTKALNQAGLHIGEKRVDNTEAITATMAQNVAKIIKEFGAGTGLSDADREYATKMAGGEIALNRESIIKILDISEQLSQWVIDRHNQLARAKTADDVSLIIQPRGETAEPKKAPLTPAQ